MQPVVVYDTNILFSATGWKGTPFHCLELARHGSIKGITCIEILDELAEKLSTKLNFSSTQTRKRIEYLSSFLRLVTINNTLKIVDADPDDDKVIECAVVGSATHIVTGDSHLLKLGNYQNIQIVTAADFYAQFSR
ncbi:putative toxin-antitoxin system toxin component, PIN family [Candidatus Poribacteria bacterium]|nr:putative toxin-antitoxin system toxin component, PIN family [Candidatus Poribacteria bacterium]